MTVERAKLIKKSLLKVDAKEIRKAITNDKARADLLAKTGISTKEFDDYLSGKVNLVVGNTTVVSDRRSVIQAVHVCC